MNQNNTLTHHLFIGGTGAVAATYATALSTQKDQKVSIYIRPKYYNQLKKNPIFYVDHVAIILYKRVIYSILLTIIISYFSSSFNIIRLIMLFIINYYILYKYINIKANRQCYQIPLDCIYTNILKQYKKEHDDINYIWLCLSPIHLYHDSGKWLYNIFNHIYQVNQLKKKKILPLS